LCKDSNGRQKPATQPFKKAVEKEKPMSAANREYKNSVFKNLFHDTERALELYNALTDSRFTAYDDLSFTSFITARRTARTRQR